MPYCLIDIVSVVFLVLLKLFEFSFCIFVFICYSSDPFFINRCWKFRNIWVDKYWQHSSSCIDFLVNYLVWHCGGVAIVSWIHCSGILRVALQQDSGGSVAYCFVVSVLASLQILLCSSIAGGLTAELIFWLWYGDDAILLLWCFCVAYAMVSSQQQWKCGSGGIIMVLLCWWQCRSWKN